VTVAEQRRETMRRQRVDTGILNVRIRLVCDPELRGEARKDAERELETLRLARLGVRTPYTLDYLARYGVTPGQRRHVMRRGPEVWGGRVRAYAR
jgi:hypothetical protein